MGLSQSFSALALCRPSAHMLLTAPSPSPLPRIPCLSPPRGLCSCKGHSSLLNHHLLLHTGALHNKGENASPSPGHSAATGTLSAALQSTTASTYADTILSSTPFSGTFVAITPSKLVLSRPSLVAIFPDPKDTLHCSSYPASQAPLAL